MTEEKNTKSLRNNEVRREIIQAYKHRYAQMYQKRWGKRPPDPNSPRILVVHDADYPRKEITALREWLGSHEAVVESRPLDESADAYRPAGDYDAIVVATGRTPDQEGRDRLRALLHEVDGRRGWIAGIGDGVLLLLQEGFLRNRRTALLRENRKEATEHGARWVEEPVVRDGNYFTCSGREGASELARALLEAIDAPGSAESEDHGPTRTNP